MSSKILKRTLCGLVLAIIDAIILPIDGAYAGGFKVLYSFTGGNDGGAPHAGVIRDRHGNLYGATTENGGTVFELALNGNLTELNFCGGGPGGTLVRDKKGDLYGTFVNGGGGVFEIPAGGTCTILQSFRGPPDGYDPEAGLLRDGKGNLYGTTVAGGSGGVCSGYGCGTVFRIAPNGQETVLYSFTGGSDGAFPFSHLIMDGAGNLYGTTAEGGYFGGDCGVRGGGGTVFKIAPDGTESVLHSFTGCEGAPPSNDGYAPYSGVIVDSAGNLYGTASEGGAVGYGAVFKLAPDGTEGLLHSFNLATDGADPIGGLTWDKQGNLYGTTAQRGTKDGGGGTVFKISANGKFSVLHRFLGNDGLDPQDTLLADDAGYLFGTTYSGGPDNAGVVFRLKE